MLNEVTNPSNIGSYKNTSIDLLPERTPHNWREPINHTSWHRHTLIKEGFLTDLISTVTKDVDTTKESRELFEEMIDPHTVEDLYSAVCLVLTNKVNDEDVKKAASLLLSKSTSNESTLLKNYKSKAEDAVMDYCIDDGLDIMKRLLNTYSADQLDGDKVFATILSKVDTNEYTLKDDIEKLYKEYVAKEPQDNTTKSFSTKQPNYKQQVDKIVKSLQKQVPEATPEQIMNLIADMAESGDGLLTSTLKAYVR